MALRLSTGVRRGLACSSGLMEQLNGGFIGIFSGSQPDAADNAETGSLLMYVSATSGTLGLTFGTDGSGSIIQGSTTFSGTVGTGGVAGWFRIYDSNKTTGSNGTAIRIDGSVGVSGADMTLANVSLVQGATVTIDTFTLTVPANA